MSISIPSTTERVTMNTTWEQNRRIKQQTERNIAYYAANPDEIDARLIELDKEWDIERTLEANAATVSVASVVLGLLVSRKFLFLPALVGGFLLQHAVKGWCPPLPIFRKMGVRTQTEIERERYALKALRGDFEGIIDTESNDTTSRISHRVLAAVE